MDKNKEEGVKRQYRVKNWAEYNRALVNRGDLTLWISEEVAEGWYNQEKTGRKGSSDIYSDLAVECGLTFREMYKIRLGMTQGFLNGLFKDCKAPDYTTLCKRGKRLEIRIPRSRMSGKRTVVVDSTGLKVYGEGEWKVKKHGTDGKRRTWRKLHLAVDAGNLEVVGMELTSNEVGDGEVLPDLLAQLPHGDCAGVRKKGGRSMEKGQRLSPTKFGGECDVPDQATVWREFKESVV